MLYKEIGNGEAVVLSSSAAFEGEWWELLSLSSPHASNPS